MAYHLLVHIEKVVYALMWLEDNGKVIATDLALVGLSFCLVKFCKNYYNRHRLWKKREDKQSDRNEALKSLFYRLQQSGISEEEVDNICSLSLSQLQKKLKSGELSAINALHAYQDKALQVNNKTNALVDIIDNAEEMAKACDNIEDRVSRILHGIPISIKDNLPVQGYDSTIGLSCGIDKPYPEDCVLVKVLRHQGAIPFVRTNVPQTLLSYDTTNPIFGQTYNPHGEGRSAGGSSGGEAALIAGGGSPLGLGSDIGGSIRIPASFCGVCALKPTHGRFSSKGVNPIFKGQNAVLASYGPLGRDVDSLVLMMKALMCQHHFDLDKTIPPLLFNDEVFTRKKKPRIGFYLHDGYIEAVPAMCRAVDISVRELRKQNYEVIEWKFPNIGLRGATLWSKAMFADGGKSLLNLLQYDAVDHSVGMLYMALCLNRTLFRTISFVVGLVYPRIGASIKNILGLGSVSEWEKLVRDIQAFRQEVEGDLRERGIEALLCPSFTMPAIPVRAHRRCQGAASYTMLMNVLNFPAGTLPVTAVTAEDTANMVNYPTPDIWASVIKQSMVGSEGLPVGVQVATLPWQDETCLRVMKDLESALKTAAH